MDAGADSSPRDGGGDAASSPPSVLFVHAAPGLPDVRLCWSNGGTVTTDVPFPATGDRPASNYPAISVGGAVAMPDATALIGADTIYAIDAVTLTQKPQQSCRDLLLCNQPPCLNKNRDYWEAALPAAPRILHGVQGVIALSGCLAIVLDEAGTISRCGSDWTPASGNLHAEVLTLAPLPVAPMADAGPVLAVQTAQLSPGLAALTGDGGAAYVSFGAQDELDAAAIAALSHEGDLQPQGTSTVALGGGIAMFGAMGFGVNVPADDSGAGQLWMSLAQAQELVDPTQDPTMFFGHRQTYLVAVLGDPLAPHAFAAEGGYDGTGLHLLVVSAAAAAAPGDE
jgi:hypothetical protein